MGKLLFTPLFARMRLPLYKCDLRLYLFEPPTSARISGKWDMDN
jgi:hypothetical protein